MKFSILETEYTHFDEKCQLDLEFMSTMKSKVFLKIKEIIDQSKAKIIKKTSEGIQIEQWVS